MFVAGQTHGPQNASMRDLISLAYFTSRTGLTPLVPFISPLAGVLRVLEGARKLLL